MKFAGRSLMHGLGGKIRNFRSMEMHVLINQQRNSHSLSKSLGQKTGGRATYAKDWG
jgi:hypothetical protein